MADTIKEAQPTLVLATMNILAATALASVFCASVSSLSAQVPGSGTSPDSSANAQSHPAFALGISGGGASFRNGSSSQAVATIIEYSFLRSITLSTSPTIARATDSTGRFVTSGILDLPIDVGVWHRFEGPLSPSLGFSVGITMPVGDTTTGFGNGTSSFGGSVGASVSPTEVLHLSVGAGRGLTGTSGSAYAPGSTTSVSAEASVDIGERASAGISYGGNFGSSAAEPLARVIGGGLSYSLAGPLTVALDASHGYGSQSAKWAFSLGIGTAFAGISPVSATTPLRRLRKLFNGNGIGSSKKSGSSSGASCRARKCR